MPQSKHAEASKETDGGRDPGRAQCHAGHHQDGGEADQGADEEKAALNYQIYSVQVWYRIFHYTHGEHYSEHRIPLGRGYFIDLFAGTLPGLVASLERLQNRTPALDLKLKRLRFYLRWIEPVIRFPFLLLLPRLLARLRAGSMGDRKSLPTIQNCRHAHSQPSKGNREDV